MVKTFVNSFVHHYNNTDIFASFFFNYGHKVVLCCVVYCADTLQSVPLHTNLRFCFRPAVNAASTPLHEAATQSSITCRTTLYIFLLDIFAVSAANSQLRCLPPRPICTSAPKLPTKH